MNRKNASDVLFITLDSCRYDTFLRAHRSRSIPFLSAVGPLHKAQSPSYFTYGSHSAMWMGFLPGLSNVMQPWLNPKAGKLFRMAFSGHKGDCSGSFLLEGENIIDGFNRLGYRTLGSGSVDWFDPSTETGSVLGRSFQSFYFSGNTWSLSDQLFWLNERISLTPTDQPLFVFLNVGETHVPYWHHDAGWSRLPSPCRPFGGSQCDRAESARRQLACLEWADSRLGPLLAQFLDATIVICADHGDCWGEDGLWEHGVSHSATLTVPLLLRVRGIPVHRKGQSLRFVAYFRYLMNRLYSFVRTICS